MKPSLRCLSPFILCSLLLAMLLVLPKRASSQWIQFHDATDEAGITANDPNGYGHGSSFGDYNGDGWPDIYVMSYASANFLFRNDRGRFMDIAAAAGVQDPTHADRGMASADYDNDGDLDIYIAAGYSGNVLYRNNGNDTFSKVTVAAGVEVDGQGQGVAWGDYDNDGLLDLFVAQTDGSNRLFRQNHDHRFSDATAAAGINQESFSLQPVFFDVDGDGDVDLLVTRKENQPNLLYINNGNGTFSERARRWGIDSPAAHSQGVAIGDYDRDGDFDVYICDYDGYNLLFRNRGDHFEEIGDSAGVRAEAAGNRGAVFADFDDDGWLDLYVTRRGENKMFRNNGSGTFTNVSAVSGANDSNNGYSPSIADYDNDGDLDIFFTNTGQNSVLLKNQGLFNNWLQITLVGKASNRNGVGAKLTAWMNGQQQTQTIVAGQAYLCTGSDLTAHFGLGASSRVDSLIIAWPSGTRDQFFQIAANQKLHVLEESGPPPADTTKPKILEVVACNVTSSGATIFWSTNENADSQVEFGLSTNYGSHSALDSTRGRYHVVSLVNLTANTTYHYRVKSKDAAGNLATSGDFTFQTSIFGTTPSEEVVLNDPLNKTTLGKLVGGQFVADGGWQVTDAEDMIVYDLGRYIENGMLEMEVRNFSPPEQNTASRHHFVGMYRMPWGNHHPIENQETVWVLHAGSFYEPGVKLLSWTYDEHESNTEIPAPWYRTQTYHLKIVWNCNQLQYYRDGILQASHSHSSEMQLRYLYLGRDLTVSADLITGYKNNQYPALVGPIYSNIVVKEIVTPGESLPVQIITVMPSEPYGNGARLSWTTDEPSICYVEYGLTNAYGQRTPVLGPPAQTFTTALAKLAPNQTYHYRIVAVDNFGNRRTTNDQIVTTLPGGTYLFKPSADTYVEAAGFYGTTRDHANLGWMNLLAGPGRECYLSFEVTGVTGEITNATLRLHGRQSGYGGGSLRPLFASWDENTVTWLNKPTASCKQLGTIDQVQAAQWHEVDVSAQVKKNGRYDFALIGSGKQVVSFDSRESTNLQPELIVSTTLPPSLPTVFLYTPYEVQLCTNKQYDNPYVDVSLTGVFVSPSGKELRLSGFWDGEQIWRVRFSPNETGLWKYHTESVDTELVSSGAFQAVPSSPAQRGFVRVSRSRPYQFEYSDGTPFLLMGDTNWEAMSLGVGFETRFKPYINLRASQHFNAYHAIVVNSRYDYQSNEGGPPFWVVSPETRDYNHLLPDFFKWVDRRVAYADNAGMVSILFFTWAKELRKMTAEQYQRLALYMVSRYAAYNVFWVLAGDYQTDFYQPAFYRQVGQAVAEADPYDHPISIHPADGFVNREFAKEPWLSYIMQQLRDAGEFLADSVQMDRLYNKPVVNGEYGYHVPASVHPLHGIRSDAHYTRTGAWSIFMAGGYFVAGFEHTFRDPEGHYPYDPQFDTPPLHWDLNDPKDLEAARQYSAFSQFFRDHTSWAELEPHREFVLDGQSELMAKPGVEYVVYNARGGRMRFQLPAAQYFSLAWFDPIAGVLYPPRIFESTGETVLIMPSDTLDAVALLRPATAPAITSAGSIVELQSELLNRRHVRFRWQTPEPADSRIDLHKPNGKRIQFIDTKETTQHEFVLDSLAPDTNYTVVVSSRTTDGREWTTQAHCPLTTIVVMDKWIEAESMPVKTSGRAEPPGWNLNTNGHLAISLNFPQSGRYNFEIRARGEYRQKTWPKLTLQMDNDREDTLSVNSAVYHKFTIPREVPAGTHTLEIAFANAGDDRQLIVDWLHVQFADTAAIPKPVIKEIRVTNLTASAATISWKTDKPADAKIEYGLNTNYGFSMPLAFCRDTTHIFDLSSLRASTTYHFRVRSKDAAGKVAISKDSTFTTAADREPPLISNIAVTNLTANSATITWSTDEKSTSQIVYGLDTTYTLASPVDTNLVTAHTVALSNLKAYTIYHARVKSADDAKNIATSQDFIFKTLPAIDRLVMVSGDAQIGRPGETLAMPLVVQVLNSAGAGMPEVKVEFRVIAGGGMLKTDTSHSTQSILPTGPDGTAKIQWQLGVADTQTVEARLVEQPNLIVQFSATIDFVNAVANRAESLPTALALRHYPNPFHDLVQFEVALPQPGEIALKIFDLHGREVLTLSEGAKTAGRFFINWYGKDNASRAVASGIYFAVLRYQTGSKIGSGEPGKSSIQKQQVVYLK